VCVCVCVCVCACCQCWQDGRQFHLCVHNATVRCLELLQQYSSFGGRDIYTGLKGGCLLLMKYGRVLSFFRMRGSQIPAVR